MVSTAKKQSQSKPICKPLAGNPKRMEWKQNEIAIFEKKSQFAGVVNGVKLILTMVYRDFNPTRRLKTKPNKAK